MQECNKNKNNLRLEFVNFKKLSNHSFHVSVKSVNFSNNILLRSFFSKNYLSNKRVSIR